MNPIPDIATGPSRFRSRSISLGTLLLALVAARTAEGQQNVYSRDNSGTGLWWSDSNQPWYYATWNNNQARPDQPGGNTRNNVFIGHNANLAMTVNGAFFTLRTLELQSSASSNRTFNASDGGGISLSVGLTNNSAGSHQFNVPIGVDGSTVEFATNSGSVAFTSHFYLNANTASFSGSGTATVSGPVSGSGGGIAKSGSGTLVLAGTNSYTGSTTVGGGTLRVDGNQSSATGNVTIASGATLSGSGTIGGATTVGGTHSVGTGTGNAAQQDFSNALGYDSGSVFAWDLTTNSNASGYDKVAGDGDALSIHSAAIFRIVLGSGVDLADNFWDSALVSWTDVFSGFSGGAAFTNSLLQVGTMNGTTFQAVDTSPYGQFSISGTTVQWTAVPEPGSGLAGAMIAAAMLRRSRKKERPA